MFFIIFLLGEENKQQKKKFFDFINNYIPVSSINYDNHVSDLNGKYDILVCGSDQIWNYDLTGSDSNYYLSFDNKAKKVSYAGSFGKLKLNNQERSDAIKYLEKFAHISVRESSGKEIVDSLFNMQLAKVVLDPVFLLDKSEWQSIANKPEYNDYILLFLLHKNPNLLEFSKKLAKRKGCKIIRITNKITFDKEIIYLAGCGPKDFIGLIDNAQYVITDSFHATSMSLILNKQFFVGLKGKELENLNTRMFSLLEMFGFSQRIVGSCSFDENNEIDFSSTNEILDNKRKESIQYLF